MRKCVILLVITMFFSSCAQELDVVTFEVDGEEYITDINEGSTVKIGEVSYSAQTINGSAKKEYESMTPILDFLDDYSRRYISELDTYLILGSKTYGDKKTHLYHFFKKKNNRKGISFLVMCPYDENEKYKEQIYKVIQSAHF